MPLHESSKVRLWQKGKVAIKGALHGALREVAERPNWMVLLLRAIWNSCMTSRAVK
jgi:hypothetical protein